jgi:hypothetical protein
MISKKLSTVFSKYRGYYKLQKIRDCQYPFFQHFQAFPEFGSILNSRKSYCNNREVFLRICNKPINFLLINSYPRINYPV